MLVYMFDHKGKLNLNNIPVPSAKNHSAVIKVKACAICGTDFRTYMQGSTKINPPRVIGHEVIGVITETGEKVRGFLPGEKVMVAPAIGCGKCYWCLTGRTNMCEKLQTIGFQFDGGFAEYMEIPPIAFKMGNVIKLSSTVEDDEAALAEPVACVINAQEFLEIKKDDYVAVWGSGFIGCIHAELAFKSGASKVIMVEISQQRLEKAQKLVPGILAINPSDTDVQAKIEKITAGRGVNVGITACSAGKAQEEAQMAAAKRGRISLFGGLPGKSKGFIDSNMIHYKELAVYGVHASTPKQNRQAIEWIAGGQLKVKKYITNIYPLHDIAKAFQDIKKGHVLKAIIKP